jgi:hypothetical protein
LKSKIVFIFKAKTETDDIAEKEFEKLEEKLEKKTDGSEPKK